MFVERQPQGVVITEFYHQYDKTLIIVKNGSTIAAWLIRSALVSAGVLLAWRIVALGMAQFYTDQITPSSQDAALAWYSKHPEALRRVARNIALRDPAGAEVSLREALHADPANGETLMGLAGVWRAQNRLEDADRAVDLAGQLFPAWAKVHLQVADHWRVRGYLDRTLEHWDLALRIQADLANRLFPVLLRLANDPHGRAALASSARYSAPWWEQFLVFASQNAARVDTLRALYVFRRASGKPLSETERNAYVARLQSEELWLEGYMIWLNTLTPERLKVIGHVYDGGFELGRFEGGFDWHVSQRGSVQLEASLTYASGGRKALHVVFQGKSASESIIEQPLVLSSGAYRLGGRVRPDNLKALDGLAWILSCASEDRRILASSERFLGADQWRNFVVDFTVPSVNCAGQCLSLQVVGRHVGDFVANGEIWFDDIAIEWLNDQSN